MLNVSRIGEESPRYAMKPRSPCTLSTTALRGVSALLLALLLAAVVDAQPRPACTAPATVRALPDFPVSAQPPAGVQPKKEPDKKEPDKKDTPKMPEYKWPTDINGKTIEV